MESRLAQRKAWLRGLCCAASLCMFVGCGTTKTQQVTDQMLMSSAVDRTIGEIDFRVLGDREVFLDTRHVRAVKGVGFVNADYIISSLRQQMFASRVRLVESMSDAEVVVEARIGALGTDGHEISYGVPASSTLSSAAALVPNAPAIPTVPELSLARRTVNMGGAKIALFAYERESKDPIWQSGVKTAMSDARNFWVLGAGPFQRGSIYDGTQFAGSRLTIPMLPRITRPSARPADSESGTNQVAYDKEFYFGPRPSIEADPRVQLANGQGAAPVIQAGAQGADQTTVVPASATTPTSGQPPAAQPPVNQTPAAPPATQPAPQGQPK